MNKNWKKDITLFLAGQNLSLFGTSLVQYAITWYITMKTQSGSMMTISIICGFVPTFFLSPFAGVWADRYDRKTIIILADSLIAAAILVAAILFWTGHDALWMLFVISAVRAMGTAVQTPAVGAVLPQIVPEDKLMKVNATNSSIQSLIMLISPILSGALLILAAIEVIFFIDVITAAIAILILLFFVQIPVHAKAINRQPASYFDDMREGMAYIKDHGFLLAYFLFCAAFFILAAPAAFLTPLQVSRSFGNDVWRLTAIEIAFSAGMMLGGVIMAFWGGFKNKVRTMALATLLIGICTFALGVVPVFWIYLVFMALTGITIPMYNTPAMVLLQQRVEGNFLGRVFGVLGMISSFMMPLGMLIFGPVSDIIKIEWLLAGTGLLLFFQGFFLVSNKALIEAGKPVLEP